MLARSVWVLVCRRRTIDATNPTVRHQQRGRCDRARQEAAEPNGARRPLSRARPPRPVAQSVISTAFRFKRIRASTPARTKGTQDILVQLVIPIHINEVWSIITRTILPLVWQAVVPVGANRAVRRQPDPVLGVPVTKDTHNGWLWSIDQSCVPTVNDKSLGSNMWGGSRTGAGLYERTLGRGRAGQQHLVIGWHAWVWRRTLQHVPDAAFRHLQFWRGIVCR